MIKELIERIYNLLKDKEHWTKGTFARTAIGVSTNIHDPEAVCFCLNGAISRVAPTKGIELVIKDKVANAITDHPKAVQSYEPRYYEQPGDYILVFNDRLDVTHEDILQVIKTAKSMIVEAE